MAATGAVQELQLGWSQAYQPLADVWVQTDGDGQLQAFERILDLPTATSSTTWTTPIRSVRETSLVSAPDGVLAIEREVVNGTPFSGRVLLNAPHLGSTLRSSVRDATIIVRMPSEVRRESGTKAEHLLYDTNPGAAVTAVVALRLEHDGVSTGALSFTGVRRLRIIVTSETDFVGARTPPTQTFPAWSSMRRADARRQQSTGTRGRLGI